MQTPIAFIETSPALAAALFVAASAIAMENRGVTPALQQLQGDGS